MRKLALIALFPLLLAPCFGVEDSTPQQVIGPFGTLDNADDPMVLAPTMAQDLLNVEITSEGKSVRKRKGLGLAFTLPNSSSVVHGIYSFYDSVGNDVSLFFNDSKLSGSVNGAAITTVFSTGTVSATWQCTDSLGFAYCASTAREPIIKTNGVTYSQVLPVTSIGTMVTATGQRLVTAGFSGAPSQINLSGANNFTDWTLGGLVTSAYNETINAPGSRITHITAACNGLMWFKETSFGIILNPDDSLNAQNVILAPEIGTLDNTSVIYPGGLQFRAQDGHIYNYDCAGIEKLTRDITPTINASGSRRANSWTQTTAADFNAGSSTPTYTDTTTVSGSVGLQSIYESLNSFTDWQPSSSTGAWATTGDYFYVSDTKNGSIVAYLSSSATASAFPSHWMLHAQVGCSAVADGFGSVMYEINFVNASTEGYCLKGTGDPSGSFNIGLASLAGCTGTLASHSVSMCADTNLHNVDLVMSSTFYMQLFYDGNRMAGATVNSSFYYSGLNRILLRGNCYLNPSFCTTNHPVFNDIYIKVSSGAYYSAVHNAPSLTSWDVFSANQQTNDGTITYFTRSSTTFFTTLSSTPSWVAQTKDTLVSASTGTYFQVMSSFSVTAATQNPTINDFTFNWFEGTASDKPYGIYFGRDNAIWWSVASGSGQSTNNRILRWDLLNHGWVIYDIPSNGFLIRNQSLYIGSSSTGTISKYGDTDSDNGTAINSYWKSKDFIGDSPLSDKEFRTLSVLAKSVANSSMTVIYTLNASSSTAYTVPLYNASSSILRNNRYLPAGRVGNTINVKFGNNAADQYWELFLAAFGYLKKAWVVGN